MRYFLPETAAAAALEEVHSRVRFLILPTRGAVDDGTRVAAPVESLPR